MANLPIGEFGQSYNTTKTGDKAIQNIWNAFTKSRKLGLIPGVVELNSAIEAEKLKNDVNKTNLTEEQIKYRAFVEAYGNNFSRINTIKDSVSSDVAHLKQAKTNWDSVEATFNKYNLNLATEYDLQVAEPGINYSNIALVVTKAYGTLSRQDINLALDEIAKSLGNYNLILKQYTDTKKEFDRIKANLPGAPKPPPKPKADSKTPPQRPSGAAKSSSSAASASDGSSSAAAATPTAQTAAGVNQEATPTPDPQAEAENQFKMSLRGIVDSDQCKISRMYNYFETYFFEKKFATHPHYSALAQATPSKQYQLFEYIPANKKQAGINPSILSRVKKEEMHLWYLRNDIVSLLTKNISIYKVYREKVNGKFTGNFTNIVDLQIPHFLGEGLAYRTDEATKPSLDAVLNSFNWNYIGTDSFTAERDIEATMQITLQNMDALFAIRENSANQKYRLSDLLIQPDCFKNRQPVDPQTPSSTQQRTTKIEDDPRLPWIAECYEVMVSVGHDMPKRILDQKKLEGDSWTDPRLGNIRFEEGAFDKLKTTLFLTLVDHKINFSSNGKVQLDITYRARLGSNMRSDVLDVNGPAGQISDEQTQELKKILGYAEGQNNGVLSGVVDESATERVETDRTGYGWRAFTAGAQEVGSWIGIGDGPRFDFGNITDIGTVYRRLEELKLNYQGIESKKKVLVRIDNGLSYLRKIGTKKFFRKVLAHLLVTNRVEVLRLNNAVETKKYIQSPTKENLIKSIEELVKLMETPLEIPPEASVPTGTTGVPSGGAVQTISNTDDQRAAREASDAEGVGQVGSERDDANKAENNGAVTSEPKDISFIFFYDLLSAVIEVLLEKDKTGQAAELLKTFFIVHTNILMPDFGSQFSSDRNTWKPFNIAATPIALSTLNNFVANVAEQGKEKYPLFAVIRDMVNQLLADALGSECVDQYSSPTFIQKFLQLNDYSGDVSKINNHYSTEIADTVVGQQIGTGRGGFINAATLAKSFKDYYPIASVAAAVRSGNFARPTELLVISFENTIYREVATGRFEVDNRNGIPHIKFKDQRGLIVELSLSKTDQPYLREARYAENSGFSLLQLSNVYDANIKMKGNNLCMLGGLIYFDPTTLGNSLGIPTDDSSLSYIMGIGGLYVVTKIEHSFSIDGYTTSVQARYISRGAT